MNIRSLLNRILLLVPAALVAPLLAVATPACGTLTPTNPVSFTDHTFSFSHPFDATFNCTGVTFAGLGVVADDSVLFIGTTGFRITSDISLFGLDTNVRFTGTDSTTGQTVPFLVFEGPGPGQETVAMTPEPGSILLFGTGLLIAGGFIRRRLLVKTFA